MLKSASLFAAGLVTAAVTAAASTSTPAPTGTTPMAAAAGSSKTDPHAVIRKYIPAEPWRIAPPISDRAFWDGKRQLPFAAAAIAGADQLLAKLPSAPDDETYLEFSRRGIRANYDRLHADLYTSIGCLTLAACLTNEQKYIDAVEIQLGKILAMRTWVLSAHDGNLTNFDGKMVTIDLGSSSTAVTVAAANRLLGDRLKPQTRRELVRKLEIFIVGPLDDMLSQRRAADFWINSKNNWNAVCCANTTMTLLMMQLDPDRRYRLLKTLLGKSNNFLLGFNPNDGYCSEGASYWNYGFGHYLVMCMAFYQVTGGKLNMLNRGKALYPSEYPERIMITPDLIPAFSDCGVNIKFSPSLLGIRDFLFNIDSANRRNLNEVPKTDFIRRLLMLTLPPPKNGPVPPVKELGAFSDFSGSGVFVCRPGKLFKSCRLAGAFKAGSNHEFHNHNDVGSFVIASNGVPLLVDPGCTRYTRDTFSANRYKNRIINSYGHSVPVVGGKLQSAGDKTDAKVMRRNAFTDEVILQFNLAPAYPEAPGLRELTRKINYRRAHAGSVIIRDEGRFEAPLKFETALMTFGKWQFISPNVLRIEWRGEVLRVAIDTDSVPFEVTGEEIDDDIRYPEPVKRIAIRLRRPERKVKIELLITPETAGK